MKYLHAWPILDARVCTTDLIKEATKMLPEFAPDGYKLTRPEFHRRGDELLVLCDVEPEIVWVRHGLIWKAAA